MTHTATTSRFTPSALEELALRDGDTFAGPQRREALDRFQAMPLPSPETEEWRYTDLTEFDLSSFMPLAEQPRAQSLDDLAPGVLEAAGDIGERAGLAIQHNSTMVIAHLDQQAERAGVHFESIDDALRDHPLLLDGRLHDAVPAARTKFTALHAAFRTGGTFVYVPKDVRVEHPLQTLTYVDRDGLAVFPHTVIVLEQGAELTFIDRYASPNVERVLSDAVVEIYAGPASRLRYVSLQEWGDGVTHLSVQRAVVGRDAEVRSLAVAFGASLSRTELETLLIEPGGQSEMLGLYFAEGDQHFDFRALQDHVAPHCSSDLLCKGVLTERSRTIFSGTVHIRPNAQKSQGFQTIRNMVLSEEAHANSVPNLEIEANDVRCGHAASDGPVDEDTLFYIQSRGIPYSEAEKLVVSGFYQEVLDRVTIPEVKAGLAASIQAEIEREGARHAS